MVESELGKGSTFYLTLPPGQARMENGIAACFEPISTPEYQSLAFSNEELATLQPIIDQLKNIKVYQASSIRKIVHQLPETLEGSLLQWKTEVLQAAYTGNAEAFQELLVKGIPEDVTS